MCGIAGAMSRRGEAVADALLWRMAAAQAHRGPNGQRCYRQQDIGFAHQRLAIIDLATGDQPLFGPDGLVLIANGEIYNNPELREELADIAFATRSDCEPPLYLYHRLGPAYASRLRGMYAIALHDPGKRRLLLSRDPFGIKPLYYAETDSVFLFASEPQAILATGLVPRQERLAARDELVNLQYTTGRETIFAGLQRVLPGETLIVEAGHIVERLHLPALPARPPQKIAEDAALDHLDQLLCDAVRVHQRSDVPYGLFLSGGIDSASLLALMARVNSRPVLCFTAYFPGSQVADETALAGRLAASLGAEQVAVPVTAEDFWRLLPGIAAAMDDPAADYAILPTTKLAMAARERVTVVLSGEGGDELFAGYGRYRGVQRPWPFSRPLRRHGILEDLGLLRQTSDWRAGLERGARAQHGSGLTRLQQAQAVDCDDWLAQDLLGKLDRCLMAVGVEGRVPFLDAAVSDFAFTLPDRLKIAGGRGKYLLRRWLQRVLPAAEPFAPKRGFTVPVAEWLSARPELAKILAAQPAIDRLCRPGAVEALFADLSKRRGFAAWTLLFYALWHAHHIESRPAGGDIIETLRG